MYGVHTRTFSSGLLIDNYRQTDEDVLDLEKSMIM